MKRETLFFIGVAFVAGFLLGMIIGFNAGGKKSSTVQAQAPAQTGAFNKPVPATNYGQSIQTLSDVVARDPQNRKAWVELGNAYYQSKRHPEGIEAYGKALELDPNDPNVLTDQGTLFRRVGMYENAIENYSKASAIDPTHINSVFNTWVVARSDLNDLELAAKAAKRYLELVPTGGNSDMLRNDLQAIEQALGTQQ